jgi:hypothetical protein
MPETTLLKRARITPDGAVLQMVFQHDAEIIIDAATTVAFISAGDDMNLTITDTNNGFTPLEVGDMIEVTGSLASANNFYWLVKTKVSSGEIEVRVRHNATQPNTTQNRDGETSVAGAPITISRITGSLVPTCGSITIGGDASTTATVVMCKSEHYLHKVYTYVDAEIATPITWGQNVTLTAAQDAAWVYANGQGNSPLSAYAVGEGNKSVRKVAGTRFGYSNMTITDPLPAAPDGVSGGLDPLDDADLIDYFDPDLEVGYVDGDPISILTKQVSGLTQANQGGGQYSLYHTNAFPGGQAGVRKRNDPSSSNEWRQSFNTTNLIGPSGRTFIGVVRWNDNTYPTGPTINFYNNASWGTDINGGQFGFLCSAAPWTNRTGGCVIAVRVDASGNVVEYRNYTSFNRPTPVTSATMKWGFHASADGQSTFGKGIWIDRDVGDATIKQYIRGLLTEYGITDWAPTFYVSETGDNTNIGDAANPVASISHAMNLCTWGTSQRILIPEGDVLPTAFLYGSISSGGNQKSRKSDVAMNNKYPVVIRVDKISAVDEPTFEAKCTGSLLAQSRNGNCSQNVMIYGMVPRYQSKIPTTSPFRNIDDDPFDPTPSNQSKFVNGALNHGTTPGTPASSTIRSTSYSYPDPYLNELSVSFINCHGVGSSFISFAATTLQAHEIGFDFIECSSVHNWGGGHTLTHYVSAPLFIYYTWPMMPTGGWDPDAERSDIFSRAIYDQFGRPGCKYIDGLITAYDASSTIQLRNGGYIRRAGIIDASAGAAGKLTHVKFSDFIYEGGCREGSSQQINWGAGSVNAAFCEFEYGLFLPTRGRGAQPYSIKIDNNPADHNNNGTIGNEPADQWAVLDPQNAKMVVRNCTVAGRFGPFLDARFVYNLVVDRCIISKPGYAFFLRDTEAELSSATISITNCVVDSPTTGYASVGGVVKTSSQLASICDAFTNNTEQTVIFTDPTRSYQSYARLYLNNDTAEVEDLVHQIILDRITGNRTQALDPEFIHTWIKEGFYPLNLDPGDFSGLLPGVIQNISFEPVVESPTFANVAKTSATLGGNVIDVGSSGLTERFVIWSVTETNADPIIGGSGVTKVTAAGTSTGVFTTTVTGLPPGKNITFRAGATNSTGTTYTHVGSFTTRYDRITSVRGWARFTLRKML